MSLPLGTVTFLFTDIEGSTRLWEDHPEEMSAALARHDTLQRDLLQQHNGHIFKTVGDAFCAAFHTAPEALEAALSLQLALVTEPWPEPTPLKVRIALHTGAAESRDNDYFGPPLNRISRLLAACHGEQVLLSAATQELVRDVLPEQVALFFLGEHRLKDLGRPESIYQLFHPALPSRFPPISSLDNPELKHNLPQQVTSFVGREKQIIEVKALLKKTRLLTLTGSGGSGKTRLALQVAADLLDTSGDGVWLVELAALTDPELVPQLLASTFGVSEEPGQSLTQSLVEWLKTKRLFLVLDNCEHLLSACATLVDTLLRHCHYLSILATSREGLGISGETTYRVPSLALPDPKKPQTPASLSLYESVRLFVERAVQVRTDFTITNENAPALAAICHRLDGIPLAIELAAARVRSLSVEEVNQRLDQRFRLLTGGNRTALPRQQTLRSLIDWSYDLLSDAEKTLFCRLSVFSGGWTVEAAEQVCVGGLVEEWELLDLLTSLSDKSLVVAEQRLGHTRYRLLETIRQYSRDRLAETREGQATRNQHLAYFLALAETVEEKLVGADQQIGLEHLEIEHDNLRAALEWATGSDTEQEAGLRLAGALWRFWFIRGHFREGRDWLATFLQHDATPSLATPRAKALNGAGNLASSQGDFPTARALLEEGLALRRELGDTSGVATSLNNLGNIAFSLDDYPAARALFAESLALQRELGNPWGTAAALSNLGLVALDQGDYPAAQALFSESLTLQRELGDTWSVATTLGNLGLVAAWQGDNTAARPLQEESLALRRELGDRAGTALALGNLGNISLAQGDLPTARALFEESLTLRRELNDLRGISLAVYNLGNLAMKQGNPAAARAFYEESLQIDRSLQDRSGVAGSLEGLAPVLAAQGNPYAALQLWAAVERLREELGVPLTPNEKLEQQEQLTAARARLTDPAQAAQAWESGRSLPLEELIALAINKPEM